MESHHLETLIEIDTGAVLLVIRLTDHNRAIEINCQSITD